MYFELKIHSLLLATLSLKIIFCLGEKILTPHFSSLSRTRLALSSSDRNPNFLISAHPKPAQGEETLCQLMVEGSRAQVVPAPGEHPLLPQPVQRDRTHTKRFYVSAQQGASPCCER